MTRAAVADTISDTIADAMPTAELLPLPTPDAWGASLEWLDATGAALETHCARALVTIDEVEPVDDGSDAHGTGWGVAFVDFVRVAGDRLRHIRLLLACAHPFVRLGPAWADRASRRAGVRVPAVRAVDRRSRADSRVASPPIGGWVVLSHGATLASARAIGRP